MKVRFPEFKPARFLQSGHAQTLGAYVFRSPTQPYRAQKRIVPLEDGDSIVLHDDCPPDWQPGDRTALLLHGLAGCHRSPYMERLATKLNARGIRTFRMDLRGCGAGMALAKLPVHSGRSDDAASALKAIAQLCPESPTTIIGFSLGGNISLKLLGECGSQPPGNLDSGVAVCPPIDLLKCVATIQQSPNQFYDRYFVRLLLKQHAEKLRLRPDAVSFDYRVPPKKLIDLDNQFTAPVSGFADAFDYYEQCSSCRLAHAIRLPTLVLAAQDDPLIPSECFREADVSPDVHIVVAEGGGHLGFLGQLGVDPDRRWMDWRILDWVLHHHHHGPSAFVPKSKPVRKSDQPLLIAQP